MPDYTVCIYDKSVTIENTKHIWSYPISVIVGDKEVIGFLRSKVIKVYVGGVTPMAMFTFGLIVGYSAGVIIDTDSLTV